MKKVFLTFAFALLTAMSMMAMSDARIRETARFLTDRMAYELQLTPAQYEDCYEVNYDFIAGAQGLMDDVVYGYSDAIDTYYDYLDYRNEDLRYILNATQFGIFMGLDYFFRPIYTTARRWAFRIYDVYHNHNYFYFGLPSCYHTYHGLHSHIHHHGGFYVDRYHHAHHTGPVAIRHGHNFDTHRRNDFGDRYHHRDGHGNRNHGNNSHAGDNHGNRNHGNGNNHGIGNRDRNNNGNHAAPNRSDRVKRNERQMKRSDSQPRSVSKEAHQHQSARETKRNSSPAREHSSQPRSSSSRGGASHQSAGGSRGSASHQPAGGNRGEGGRSGGRR